MTLPALVVEIDFTNAPTSATRTWTDVSAYVRALGTSRGRQAERDQMQAGTASVTLDNLDARFNPDNSSGPYYGFLKPMRPIRVKAVWDPAYRNLLTANQSSLETDTSGWSATFSATITRSTAQAAAGVASLSIAAAGAGLSGAATPSGTSGIAVDPNGSYTALASFRAATNARTVALRIGWYTSAGSFISTTTETTGTDSTSAWTQLANSGTSPATAAYAQVEVYVESNGGAGEVHYIDKISFSDQSSTTWTLGGSYVTYPVFSGFVKSWPQEYPGSVDAVVTVDCVDAFRVLNNRRLQTSESSEATGTRIGNVLTDAGWPTGANHRDLDTGQSTVQAETLDESALFHCLLMADSEGGLFFIDSAGRAAFVDRLALLSRTLDTDLTWTDDGTGHSYQDVVLRPADDLTLWNSVSVTANALTTQTASDSTSITNHFERDLTIATALTTTNAMSDRAQYAVARYKDPATRVERIVLNGMGDTGSWPDILDREIGDLVVVVRTPPGGGDTIEQISVIEGIQLSAPQSAGRLDVTWNLSPADGQQDYLILDDATNGLLDSNRLGY